MSFIYPWVLPILSFVIIILIFISKKASLYDRYFSSSVIKKLLISNDAISDRTRDILFIISLFFIAIALARPVIFKKTIKIQENGHNIIIAIDLSRSMLARDIYPNRLTAAKQKIKSIIKNENNNYALIGFSDNSYIISPLTSDSDTLRFFLDNLDVTNISSKGTSILSAIKTADMLSKNIKNKILIIFTDGGDKRDFNKEIEFLKNKNISISILNIATKKGAPIEYEGEFLKTKTKEIYISKRNDYIKSLALQNRGVYVTYGIGNNDINSILKHINNISKENLKTKEIKEFEELFYYPLFLSILFFLFATSAIPSLRFGAVFVLLILTQSKIEANIFDFVYTNKAKQSYKDKNYKEAIKEYKKADKTDKIYYNIANSYYKNKEYKKAIQYYQKIDSKNDDINAKKNYNIANSYVKLNNLKEAEKFYEQSLKYKPDKDAEYNLKLIRQQMKKNSKNNSNKQNNNNNRQKQKNSNKNLDNSNNNKQKQENSDKNSQDKNSKQKQENSNKNLDNSNNKNRNNHKQNSINQNKLNSSDKILNKFQEQEIIKKLEQNRLKILPQIIPQQSEDTNNEDSSTW